MSPVPISRYQRPAPTAPRMNDLEFTRGLTRPRTLHGMCHCGGANVLMFPEYEYTPGGQRKLREYHCLLCRCDEHTPAAHALWAAQQRQNVDSASSSTMQPGCGRTCTRGGLDVLLTEPFPTFKEWVRTNGSKALRDKYGILAHDPKSGRTFYTAKGMGILHIPDIRNCGCAVCQQERKS